MKKILFLILIFFSPFVRAGLDEFTIATEDKSCAIHYLSSRTKHNWTIKVNPASCQNGWVEGAAEVRLFSPTKEPTETLSGFFKEGYWLDTFPPVGHIIERTQVDDKIQSLSFLLGEDKEANITYVGQLRAIQPEGRPYGAFQGCPDFRVLVVVPDPEVFSNTAFQDKMVEQGLLYARSYCAKPEILALFGATNATHPEILFHMQVDIQTESREIIPLPEKEKKEEHFPFELRTEKTDILLSVEPKEESASVFYSLPEIPKASPAPKKPKKEMDILSHLQILSRAFHQPVTGRVVVHISQVLLDGTGITDLPSEIQLLYYPGLKTGWAVIEGVFQEDRMQVSDVQFCKQEWCEDVP
ncbi:MAG: hypothetical protein ACI4OR_03745 [Alphaproteobacteria bacterium]